MRKNSKIFIAGHHGLAGGAILRRLKKDGFNNLIYRRSHELDLRDQAQTRKFFEKEKPEYIFLAAAKVGGIGANSLYPAEFIHDNLMIEANVIDSAWRNGATKLLFLGSSCIYPKEAPQPMEESSLMSGFLDKNHDCYALAKIAGIRMGQAYREQYGFDVISVMPPNLYGPGDNFHSQNSHVIPAMIRRFHEAKLHNHSKTVIWGTGTPLREIMHADDLADASLFLMNNYSKREHINIGTGEEISILALARLVAEIVGYKGRIITDPTKPDGTLRKIMNSEKLRSLGWRPQITLKDGLMKTYEWYRRQPDESLRK